MYCQHCGLEVNINEGKLLKQNASLKAKKNKEIEALNKSLLDAKNEQEKEEINNRINTLKEDIKAIDDDIYSYNNNIKKAYVCPRCSHIIKNDLDSDDLKELSQASHAALHRAKNKFSSGMVFLMLGFIFTSISFLFFSMSFKATAGNKLVTNCVEFYVFIGLLIIGLVLLALGFVLGGKGIINLKKYRNLLKDIQNDTFVQ